MGAWEPGLYSDDFAADLRTTISTVCRLPLSGEEIVGLLQELEPLAATPGDEDYTTFWLVVADQLHQRGITSPARERARAIIDDRSNLIGLEEREMSEADLRKREVALLALRDELESPLPDKPRRVLRSPQPLLVSPGEVFAFPVDARGNVRNPYFPDGVDAGMDAIGWGCCVVVAADHALGYLAWYAVRPDLTIEPHRPTLARAVERLQARPVGLGTLSKAHLRRMGWEQLGTIATPDVVQPEPDEILQVVASDISISNALCRWENLAM
ncbi:hypothetical protein [uncultured Cellulomonas sp.]|uniref:hypothetical protein n=1 Tax=uncultured Cellulomonas sp. TaxID=189682 RepID=UPI0028E2E2CF|nr:hypothetical protein [uncultured Cellulomonas sp.]